MSKDTTLQLVSERGWRSGLANMMRLENRRWWGTRRWLVQSLVWLVVLNGLLAVGLWIQPAADPEEAMGAAQAFDVMLTLMGFAPFSVMIIVQGAIVGEKQSGTAAWILSSPVSRVAFILSKLIASAIGFLVTLVVLQNLIAYLQFSLSEGGLLPPIPFVVALSLQALHLVFYLTLTLMLGAFFSEPGPVMAIPIVILFSQGFLESLVKGFAPWFPKIMPSKLVELARLVSFGAPLPSFIPIVATLLFSLVFVLVAIWRFNREEF